MSFTDLFESGTHSRNVGHFASLANIALSDGVMKEAEEKLLKRFKQKLHITDQEAADILKDPSKYPINHQYSAEKRLERMLDLFKMIFSDFEIDDDERVLIERYAIGLGYTEELARKLIKRSIQIFQGGLDLDDYRYLLNK